MPDWPDLNVPPLVGILRGFDTGTAVRAVEAVRRGGLGLVEVTMNSPEAVATLAALRRTAGGEVQIGAGTVCTVTQLEQALEAGATFIVTPVVVPEVIEGCRQRGVPVIPGAFTPTEIYQAWTLGATMVKVFPAEVLGPAFVRAVKAPLPQIRLMPTGGVTVETLGEFARAGADAFGVGGPLFAPELIQGEDWQGLEARARAFVEAYREATKRGARK